MSHSDPNRPFHYALLASLALHALLFLGFPDLIEGARRAVQSLPPPIIARLIAPEPTPAPPAAPEAPPEVPKKPPAPPKKVSKPVVKPLPSPVPPPVAAPEPSPLPPPPAPAASAPPAPPAPPAPDPSVAAQAAAAQAEAQARAAEAAREARTIGEYRMELIEAARRIKDRTRYPPLARDNNWTGNTRVGVAVPAGGAPAISVRASSGHQVLDQHALAIFQQATREVPVPGELRGKAFAIEVRMDFTLKD